MRVALSLNAGLVFVFAVGTLHATAGSAFVTPPFSVTAPRTESSAGHFVSYRIQGATRIVALTKAADGNIWFMNREPAFIGFITPTGKVTEYNVQCQRFPPAEVNYNLAGGDVSAKTGLLVFHWGCGKGQWPKDYGYGTIATASGAITLYGTNYTWESFHHLPDLDSELYVTTPGHLYAQNVRTHQLIDVAFPPPASGYAKVLHRYAGYYDLPFLGSDGNIWFSDTHSPYSNTISYIGAWFRDYLSSGGADFANGNDGYLWVGSNCPGTVAPYTGQVYRVSYTNQQDVQAFGSIACTGTDDYYLSHTFVPGPDASIWMANGPYGSSVPPKMLASMSRLGADGGVSYYPMPHNLGVYELVTGSDGNIWVASDTGGITVFRSRYAMTGEPVSLVLRSGATGEVKVREEAHAQLLGSGANCADAKSTVESARDWQIFKVTARSSGVCLLTFTDSATGERLEYSVTVSPGRH